MIELINHNNSPIWTDKNNKMSKLKNGARRYSEMITKYYYPVFYNCFSSDARRTAVIAVTSESSHVTFPNYDRIFCFRHECRYKQQPTIPRCRRFCEDNIHSNNIFIVWEESTAKRLNSLGMPAIFLPMAIDVGEVTQYLDKSIKKHDAIIWYGQIRKGKKKYFEHFKLQCEHHHIRFDYISNNKFNGKGKILSRKEIMCILQRYKYGVGVGICAHEMSALGLKVFIYSYTYNCNCAYTKLQGRHYIHRNLCSPEEANIDLTTALKNRNKLVVIDPVDIKDNIKILRQNLLQYK